ncbi:MAG: CHAD domain-containing protein [Actinomycetota bacterium]|nr:CHAD domain-containing protein [Actinomycetota bacterium]
MAKAREIPGLAPDVPFAEAARRTIAVRADELFDHADGVLDTGDIERVHDMRVASRRLRAVLEIFAPCFDPALFRPVLRDVKRLADALGARRDPDVQLAAVARLTQAMGEGERPGLELVAGTFAREQAAGNEVLAAALREAQEGDLRGRLAALAEGAR